MENCGQGFRFWVHVKEAIRMDSLRFKGIRADAEASNANAATITSPCLNLFS